MNATLIYLLVVLGGGAVLAGAVWDLTRGRRDLKSADREARHMNHTQKLH